MEDLEGPEIDALQSTPGLKVRVLWPLYMERKQVEDAWHEPSSRHHPGNHDASVKNTCRDIVSDAGTES